MSLEIESITKRFGEVVALDGVSLRVEPGQVFGFLGANGAGKTTAMRIVLDILRPDTGTVRWEGLPNTEVPRRTWGYLPEERGLYARMKVLDQLVFFGELQGLRPAAARREALEWLERFRIPDYAGRRAEQLSKGNQQKVQFIAAILHDPDVLLMDEPFTGLDPVNVALLKEAFLELRQRGKTLVFSTHQMETVEELCESIAILDRGRVVVTGPVREVRAAGGRRMVRLAVADDPELDWLDSEPGVHVIRHGQDYTEAEVARDRDPATILAEALRRGGRVTHFEIADPSLEQVFIERVGAIDRSERTLAPRAAGVEG
ncbi:MAG TPA: ATP-binding cassette domain-containing protein [Candidatus Limnocylindrales bacterium]